VKDIELVFQDLPNYRTCDAAPESKTKLDMKSGECYIVVEKLVGNQSVPKEIVVKGARFDLTQAPEEASYAASLHDLVQHH
jgi:hypothetical protein